MFKKLLACFIIISFLISISIVGSAQTNNKNSHWVGQDVVFEEEIDENTNYVLTKDGDFIIELRSNSEGILKIDTENYGKGNFQIQSMGGYPLFNYTVRPQQFDVNPKQRIGLEDNMKFEIDSNRTDYDIVLSSDNLDSRTIFDIVEAYPYRVDFDNENVYLEDVSRKQTVYFDTSGLSNGKYSINWAVNDTVNTSKTTIIKSEINDNYVNFSSDFYEGSIGDNVIIDMNMRGIREIELEINDEEYSHKFTVIDLDEDGKATISFDTLQAGSRSYPVQGLNNTKVEQTTDEYLRDNIQIGSYELDMYVNDKHISSSTMDINKPRIEGINIGSISKNTNIDSISNIRSSLKPADSISIKDYMFVSVEISGVHSYLDKEFDPTELEDGILSEKGITLDITERYAQPNRQLDKLDLKSIDKAYSDDKEDKLILVIPASELPNAGSDIPSKTRILNEYTVDFNIDSSENDIFDIDFKQSKNIAIHKYKLYSHNRVLQDGSFNNIGIIDLENPIVKYNTSISEGQNITARVDIEGSDIMTRQLKVNNGKISFKINKNDISYNNEVEIHIDETEQSFEYKIGSKELLTNVTMPETVAPGEPFNIRTQIKDNLESYNIETSVNSNILVQNENGTYTVPKATPEDTYEIEVISTSPDGLFVDSYQTTLIVENRELPPKRSNIKMTSYNINNYGIINETYYANFTLSNSGNKTGAKNVQLIVNENTVASRNLSISEGEIKQEELTWVPSKKGEYRLTLKIGDKKYSKALLIEESQDNKKEEKERFNLIQQILRVFGISSGK
jgi:hypothetical protein